MSQDAVILDLLAARIDDAAAQVRPIPQLDSDAQIDIETAYKLQHRVVERRVARGNPIVGMKLGFTNQAKAAQMGVFDVIAGSLTADMMLMDGDSLDLAELIHPRVEPELAFLLGRDLDLTSPVDPPFAEAVVAVAPALEVIDSRYENFSFSLGDVIADNTSAAKFVLGQWVSVEPRELVNLGVTLDIDGQVAATGSTAAVLGDPLRAYTACCRMARAYGFTLPAGSILLAGAATVALPLAGARAVAARVTGLGSARLHISTAREGSHD